MPFIEINGASLYYETFGRDHPLRAPIVLIHGSWGTGRDNWHAIAPLLATRYRVIVPDCRGHGQSTNPQLSYSFEEMAADTAALIRALGYQRAHVIGHSNGGNVALVTLLEHPDVVQTCIPQAANAFVSPDLIEREPKALDPERIEREEPDWLNKMVALHGPTHGADYWRDLIRLTLHAIVTGPNYTPADLAQVDRPVLAIQGEHDQVNAPGRHAQFIAEHIPAAELWIPKNIAHNVHEEAPLDWLGRVFDFLARRGDDANDALYRLKRARYADERETIFDVRCSPLPKGEGWGFRGTVLTADQHQTAFAVLPLQPAADDVRVLLTEDTPWALVKRSVADLRREPKSDSEQTSQLLSGEAVRVLDQHDHWLQVRVEHDGYIGWSRAGALQLCDRKMARAYQKAAQVLVRVAVASAFERPASTAPQVGKLPFGVALPVIEEKRGFSAVCLPDERVWWIKTADLLPLSQRPRPNAAGIAFTLDLLRQLVGTPYQWGGRSSFGYDCSGLAQTFYALLGVRIPRDADQQFRDGKMVQGTARPGDLLFFTDKNDVFSTRLNRVTHVAISLGGDEIIHANGSSWNVAYNSLDPASALYRADLRECLAGVRRF